MKPLVLNHHNPILIVNMYFKQAIYWAVYFSLKEIHFGQWYFYSRFVYCFSTVCKKTQLMTMLKTTFSGGNTSAFDCGKAVPGGVGEGNRKGSSPGPRAAGAGAGPVSPPLVWLMAASLCCLEKGN